MMNLFGNPDGSSAVDYTVNCAIGIPFATGPTHGDKPVNPVNHVLPAWDAITGVTAAMGILAAERHRLRTGEGQFIKLALADVAMAMVGNLGYIGEAQVNHEDHYSFGNYLYGAYGRDFETEDDRYVYVVAITKRQWQALCKATGLPSRLALIEPLLGVDLSQEGDRFKARDAISAVLQPWFAERTLDEVRAGLRRDRRLLGAVSDLPADGRETIRAARTATRCSRCWNSRASAATWCPGSPLALRRRWPREAPGRAPVLGEHTDEVLAEVLGLSDGEIGKLRDKRIVGGPIEL